MNTKFSHHMIKEIYEEPRVVQAVLDQGLKEIREITSEIQLKGFKMVYVTGSGTSYHAGLVAQYMLSTLAELPTVAIPASEFAQWVPLTFPKKTLLIVISQSGESSDILVATRTALDRGIHTLAITNTPSSSLAEISHYTLLTHAGEELAVTATKSYTAQLAILSMLTLEMANLEDRKPENIDELRKKLLITPEFVSETIISNRDLMRELADTYSRVNYFFLLGSGPNYATALEGALKLKEACNVFAEGFAGREFLHGPIQLIDGRTPILFLVTEDEIENFTSLMRTIIKFGGPLISVSEKADVLSGVSTNVVSIPEGFPKVFSPILYVIPLQLFAYYSSIARNLNPDKPEKLRKVVKYEN